MNDVTHAPVDDPVARAVRVGVDDLQPGGGDVRGGGDSRTLIRAATADDVQTIAELGEHFHAEAGWDDIADYSVEDCSRTLAFMANDPNSILLVAEDNGEIVGMAGALTFPLYFNASHRAAQELFWYMKPGQRNGTGKHLLEAMEFEAKARGCGSIIMIALDKVNPEATGRYYRHRGYRASEHSWIRRL